MKKVTLTQGQFALVDDEDYERVIQHRWRACKQSGKWYASRGVKCPDGKWRPQGMHRFILGLEPGDPREADHINHDTLDNRRRNLRAVTTAENQQNQKVRKGYCRRRNVYQAQIKKNGVTTYLGDFKTPEEAHAAYLGAKAVLHTAWNHNNK